MTVVSLPSSQAPPTYDILIATIPHRHDKLVSVLDALDPQMQEGVGVLVYRDNLDVPWVEKCRALEEASTADYISHLDDDDMVSPDFVPRIMEALTSRPDYVGFRVRWTQDGIYQMPVVHSLVSPGWHNADGALFRDIVDKNPIRRDLALQTSWEGANGADRTWALGLRRLGIVKREVFIDAEVYRYQESRDDTFMTLRAPMEDPLPELPRYPWLRYIP